LQTKKLPPVLELPLINRLLLQRFHIARSSLAEPNSRAS
jgi:hypothetical protein